MTFNPELGEPTKIVNDNQQSPRLQSRADDTQNDGTQIKITLYTVDNAIIQYLSDRIRPVVTQNGTAVKVPIIYGDPERWKSAQRDGVLRDSIGKIQLPMLMIRRSSMKKASNNSPVNKYYDRVFYTGWNRRTPYDRFAVVNNIAPSREYYNTTAVPDYYEFTYKCLVWTEYMEQMNGVVENISFESDEFWGEPNSYKFRTTINQFSTTTQLPNNSDRVVRTEFDMKVSGYLLPESQLDAGHNRGLVTRKRYGIKKVVTFTELEGQ
jgi:hypothetical protein